MRIGRGLLGLGALAAAAGLGWQLWLRPAELPVAVLTRGTAAEIVYATGAVEPVRWAAVAPLSRGRIVEICICEGETVARGDPLLRLDDLAAQAHLRELEARLELAAKSLTRVEALLERRVVSTDRYDQALAEVAELSAARARALADLDALVLRTPMDGRVLRLDAEVGEAADPGAPLVWVGQPSPLRVTAEVNEEDIPRVLVGQKALLKADAFPDRALAAEVAAITPMGDPRLRTYRVRLSLPEDTPLRIGMSVEVNVVVREIADALLAPSAALVDGAVFALEDGRLRRVPVETGLAAAEAVQILSGLAEGARVVSPAGAALRDGQRARAAP